MMHVVGRYNVFLFIAATLMINAGCALKATNPPDKSVVPSITGTRTEAGGAPSLVTITLVDSDGAPFSGIIPTFKATDTGATNIYGPCSSSDSTGRSTCTLSSMKSETKILEVTSPTSIIGDSVIFDPGPPTSIVFSVAPSTEGMAGTPLVLQPQVTLYDSIGNVVVNFTGGITLAPFSDSTCLTTGSGTLNATSSTIIPSQGVSQFSNVSYTKSGDLYLKASISSGLAVCSPLISIAPAPPSKLVFQTQPSATGTAGVVLAIQPEIAIQDTYSNLIATASHSITLSVFTNATCTSTATGTFTVSANPVSATSGTASFSGISHTKATNLYLKASASGLSSACSSVIAVSPNVASALTSTLTGTTPIAANAIHSSTVTITLKDQYNNARAGEIPTFSATDSGATNIYSSCTTTNGSGVSTCSLKSLTPETKTLSLTSPANFNGGSVIFVSPPDAANSSITGTGPVIANGVAISTITIVMNDVSNLPVVGIRPSFSVVSGTGNIFGTCSISDSLGTSTCTLKSTKSGERTLRITSPFTLVGGNVTFVPGPPSTSRSTITGTSQIVADGVATSTITLTLRDANSNGIEGTTPTFSATDTGSTNVYSACSIGNSSGVSTCTLKSTIAETKTLSITSPISMNGGSVVFKSGPAVKIAFTTQPSSTASAGINLSTQPVVKILDAFDNTATTASNTITLSAKTDNTCTSNATGTLSASSNPLNATSGVGAFSGIYYTNVETIYLSASVSGFSSICSNSITVSAGNVSQLTFAPQPSPESLIGETLLIQPVLLLTDAYGNTANSTTHAVTLSAYQDSQCTVASTGTLGVSTNPISTANGTATFSGINYNQEESVYLKASTGSASSCSSEIKITRWKSVSSTSAPEARTDQTAVWTGTDLIVWGGTTGTSALNTGGIFNLSSNTWSSTSTGANVPTAREMHTAIWTGTQMIIWGGQSGSTYFQSGGLFNPSTNSWSALPVDANTPSARSSHTAIWTGTQMIIWGGIDSSGYLNDGGIYDPSTGGWTALSGSLEGSPSARSDHTALWTGSKMIIWGGKNALGTLNAGANFDPSTLTWSSLTASNAPSERVGHGSIWSGSGFLTWGGTNGTNPLNTGGHYVPDDGGSWSVMTTLDAPQARTGHSMLWTGTNVLIWGGLGDSTTLNSGAFFDPTGAGTWSATSSGVNLPSARSRHTAVWTGSKMILWGGCLTGDTPCSQRTNTGAVFKP